MLVLVEHCSSTVSLNPCGLVGDSFKAAPQDHFEDKFCGLYNSEEYPSAFPKAQT